MAAIIYSLCALTSVTCLVLLWRSWRASGARLLFWAALCFACLSVNNVLLVVDRVLLPTEIDLGIWRLSWALAAVLLLLFGLVWGEE
jgi:ABC-type transport system involved in multi-copper enzyme maturation permease subunit